MNTKVSALSQFLDSDFFYYFKKNKLVVVSFFIFLIFVLVALFAPLFLHRITRMIWHQLTSWTQKLHRCG